MDKKYKIFVSSTYTDLVDERQEVFKALIEKGHFPVGMEAFPSINMKQLEYIKEIIDDCDYYILIVAGMYGTLAEDGISYTEKEYEYALSKNIPTMNFIHEDYKKLSGNKIEDTDTGKAKLEAFIQKASTDNVRTTYNNVDQLIRKIYNSLDYSIKKFPREGWVRANQIANNETLTDDINLRKENDALKAKLLEYENFSKGRADISAEIFETMNGQHKLRISNNGNCTAKNIRITEKKTHILLGIEDVFPHALKVNQHIDLIAAIVMGSPRKIEIEVTWDDEEANDKTETLSVLLY